jgi:hypothetical protein
MVRIHASSRVVVIASTLFPVLMFQLDPVLAMGSADHDLARDMATTVYGVPYDRPTTPRAAPAADQAPADAAGGPAARSRCGVATGKPPGCPDAPPRRQ